MDKFQKPSDFEFFVRRINQILGTNILSNIKSMHFMQQSLSWEANSCSATQKKSCIFWNT
jgi:hypothetical protein